MYLIPRSLPMASRKQLLRPLLCRLITLMLLCVGPGATSLMADSFSLTINGLSRDIEPNVRSALDASNFLENDELSPRRMRRLANELPQDLQQAMRPYGYFNAQVQTSLIEVREGLWELVAELEAGPPTRVRTAEVIIDGPGAEHPEMAKWLDDWPLPPGAVVDQRKYQEAKIDLEVLSPEAGFFSGAWTRQELIVDPATNQADIHLTWSSGPGAVLGGVQFSQDAVQPWIVQRLVRFEAGDPYSLADIDQLRDDLANTGYFKRVDISEQRHMDSAPPVVDLDIKLEQRLPNDYSTSLGVGSETGPRLQFGWKRFLHSDRGDNFYTVFGIQQENTEFELYSVYNRPWGDHPGRFLFGSGLLRNERDSFNFVSDDNLEAPVPGIDGTRNTVEFRGGMRNERYLDLLEGPIQEQLFLAVLKEQFDLDNTELQRVMVVDPDSGQTQPVEDFRTDYFSSALGARWDWINMDGAGFDARGTRLIAQVLAASEVIGSEENFYQGYMDARMTFRFGDRWKVLLRGELGYTDADVQEVDLLVDDVPIELSLVDMPEQYRFRAGGDRSVRGYGFETLSNNNNGSANMITGSAEIEYRVWGDYSVAAFYDIGNAFNDWTKPQLKHGAGLGIRWYSVVGPIRLDIAQALSEVGDPWRIHFTIGTPLL